MFITETAEYTGKQQEEEEEEEDMDIQNISKQGLIPLEGDENIHDFRTELFTENNTLHKC